MTETQEAVKPSVRIERWARYTYPLNEDLEFLAGEVYGHPRFSDGTYVYTSPIVGEADGVIETRNTFYTLGESAFTDDGS